MQPPSPSRGKAVFTSLGDISNFATETPIDFNCDIFLQQKIAYIIDFHDLRGVVLKICSPSKVVICLRCALSQLPSISNCCPSKMKWNYNLCKVICECMLLQLRWVSKNTTLTTMYVVYCDWSKSTCLPACVSLTELC